MKGLILLAVALGLFGYVLYAGLVPFEEISMSVSPSIDRLLQISDRVIPDDTTVVYYSFEIAHEIPDKDIPLDALHHAIDSWESLNYGLTFVESDTPNLEIRWQKYASTDHTGLATCSSMLFGVLHHCTLDISIGAQDCNSNFIQADEGMVTNVIMHEIGHVLGLEHTTDENSLMYSTEDLQIPFDNMGYVIPVPFEDLYVGQKSLLSKESALTDQIETLNDKIAHQRILYEEYHSEYIRYEGKTLPLEEYYISQDLYTKINSKRDIINGMIEQQNLLIDKLNDIIEQLGCQPNFEITN